MIPYGQYEASLGYMGLKAMILYTGVSQRPGLSMVILPGPVTIYHALNDRIGLPEIFFVAYTCIAYSLTGDAGG